MSVFILHVCQCGEKDPGKRVAQVTLSSAG